MAKTTWIARLNLTAGQRYTSPAVPVPDGIYGVNIELNGLANNWASAVDTGFLEFGIEIDPNNDGKWQLLCSTSGMIRPLGKGVYFPTLSYIRADPIKGNVRGYITSSVSIRLGINGEVVTSLK